MTIDEAINKLNWALDNNTIENVQSAYEYIEAVELAIEALEQEPRWIPTSERYPRPDDEYKFFLVTDDKGRVSVQEFYLSLDEEPQPYFSGMVNVIAWMPLPEPYRTEMESEK